MTGGRAADAVDAPRLRGDRAGSAVPAPHRRRRNAPTECLTAPTSAAGMCWRGPGSLSRRFRRRREARPTERGGVRTKRAGPSLAAPLVCGLSSTTRPRDRYRARRVREVAAAGRVLRAGQQAWQASRESAVKNCRSVKIIRHGTVSGRRAPTRERISDRDVTAKKPNCSAASSHQPDPQQHAADCQGCGKASTNQGSRCGSACRGRARPNCGCRLRECR